MGMKASMWDDRARLGIAAGSNDAIAKQLEMRALARYIRDGMRVLDAGCGNGYTALYLAERYDIDVLGIDTSPEMIAAAQKLDTATLRGRVRFEVGNVLLPPRRKFDIAYTERVIVNLPDWATQRRAIVGLTEAAGTYLMCENSADGLAGLNEIRSLVGLPEIVAPSHNRYLRDAEIQELAADGLVARDDYSGAYYFLSRIVNAWLAAQNGEDPDYNAPVNQLALELSEFRDLTMRGQGSIWVW